VTTSSDSSTTSAQAATAPSLVERPEVAVGAAFAGGFLVALILRRLAG
jgi:hypothetical protein